MKRIVRVWGYMNVRRGSGILLPISALPSRYGIGDFGPGAYRFADVLAEMNQHYWQLLPMTPTSPFTGNSPYSSNSAFAGNPLFISPDVLVEERYITADMIDDVPDFPSGSVDYAAAEDYKTAVLERAYKTFTETGDGRGDFEQFCSENSRWLHDYALFIALKRHFKGAAWNTWPADLRDRDVAACASWAAQLGDDIAREKFFQYLFFKQWFSLRHYCARKKIRIIGDIPIYVTYDSSDVWANTDFFALDDAKKPVYVAGVPPDYFSATGQRWGNPTYLWDVLKAQGYEWWLSRIEQNLKQYDLLRIDHFRGLVAYWRIPAGEKTAVNGEWIEAPAYDFLETVMKRFPEIPLLAEDLGYITDDVRDVIRHFDLPGMKVLMFAFDDPTMKNPYLPKHYPKNAVVYTGTHDNNTVRGWFDAELDPASAQRLNDYAGMIVTREGAHLTLIEMALRSVADIAIIPLQDVLGLDAGARMNYPSKARGNWLWRLEEAQLTDEHIALMRQLTETYDRC